MQTITHFEMPEILETEAQFDVQSANALAELSTDEMDSVAGGPFIWNE